MILMWGLNAGKILEEKYLRYIIIPTIMVSDGYSNLNE